MSMAKNYGKTIVIVTYNQSIAKMADLYRRNNRAPCGSRRVTMAARRSCRRIRDEADAGYADLQRFYLVDLRRVAFGRLDGGREEQENRYSGSTEKDRIRGTSDHSMSCKSTEDLGFW